MKQDKKKRLAEALRRNLTARKERQKGMAQTEKTEPNEKQQMKADQGAYGIT